MEKITLFGGIYFFHNRMQGTLPVRPCVGLGPCIVFNYLMQQCGIRGWILPGFKPFYMDVPGPSATDSDGTLTGSDSLGTLKAAQGRQFGGTRPRSLQGSVWSFWLICVKWATLGNVSLLPVTPMALSRIPKRRISAGFLLTADCGCLSLRRSNLFPLFYTKAINSKTNTILPNAPPIRRMF